MKKAKFALLCLALILTVALTMTSCNKPECETHTFNELGICTECAYVCTHDFEYSVKEPTCTEGGFDVNICKICGFTREDPISGADPLGHSGRPCTVCGEKEDFTISTISSVDLPDNFFYDLMTKNSDYNAAIVVNGLEAVVEGEGLLIDFAEIYFVPGEDMTLSGYGNCDVTIMSSDMNGDPIARLVDAKALINENTVYVKATTDEGDNTADTWIALPPDAVMTNESADMISAMLPLVTDWAQEDAPPFFSKLLEFNKASIYLSARRFFSIFGSAATTTDGYTLSLDFEKLTALNELLYTLPIDCVIDYLYGKGSFKKLKAELPAVLDMTVAELIESIEGLGFDVDAFIDISFKLLDSIGMTEQLGITKDELSGMLADESFTSTTVGELIISTANSTMDSVLTLDTLKSELEKALTVLEGMTLYDLIAKDSINSPSEIKDTVNEAIAAFGTAAKFERYTDKSARLLGYNVKINDFMGIKVDISLINGYETEVDYSTAISEITVKIDAIPIDDAALMLLLDENEIEYTYNEGVFTVLTYEYAEHGIYNHSSYDLLWELEEGETLTMTNVDYIVKRTYLEFTLADSPMIVMTFCGD